MKCKYYSNFKRENKFKGIIDYRSLAVLLVYMFIVFKVLSLFNIGIEIKVYISIFCIIPVLSIFLVYINNDSIVNVLLNIIKFYFKKGIYIKY